MKLDVQGVPVPQGSKRVVHGRLIDVNDRKLKDWRMMVGQAATDLVMLEGPVKIRLDFFFPRPRGHFGKRGLRPSAPTYPAVRPDLDKLVRACLDALTGMAFRDDAQVTTLVAFKCYADTRTPGVRILIEEAT